MKAAASRPIPLVTALLLCTVALTLGACDRNDGSSSSDAEQAAASSPDESTADDGDTSVGSEMPDPPAAGGSVAPNVFEHPTGFGVSWLEPTDGDAHALRLARWDGSAWSEPQTVARSSKFFANWADLPSVVRTAEEQYLAHWLQKSGDPTYAYDVELARSTDGGRSWNPLGSPHTDGTATEHGFVSLVPGDGATTAVWLDGRRMADDGPMTLRATTIDGGTSVVAGEPGGPIEQPAELLDERVCEGCATDAVRTDGDVLVVYRDRSTDEIRDIAAVRRSGSEWGEPSKVSGEGWQIEGCPVNGPAVAADGSSVVVAWFTKADGRPRVRAARSTDGGREFGEPLDVAAGGGVGTPLGRVDLAFQDGDAVVSWLDSTDGDEGRAKVAVRRVGRDGEVGARVDVAETSAERSSGFPKLAPTGDGLAVVWLGDESPRKLHATTLAGDSIPPVGSGEAVGSTEQTEDGLSAGDMPEIGARELASDRTTELAPGDAYTLVNLWATWCAPCREELPILRRAADRWGGDGLRMIGLSVEGHGERSTIREFVDRREMPFEVWYAPDAPPVETFGADGVPATYVYDSDGRVVWSHDGALGEDQLAEIGEALEDDE
jgi:thiol-disulfide isomerase/thioredoxin